MSNAPQLAQLVEPGYWGTVEIRFENGTPVFIKRTTTQNLRSTRSPNDHPKSNPA